VQKNIQWLFIPVTLLFLFSGCSKTPAPNTKQTKAKDCSTIAYDDKNYRVDEKAKVEIGYASYYASCMNGRRTANGDKCNLCSYTAAHRTFPFGTMMRVTMLKNGQSVIVKVNDRGPHTKGRVVDLSTAAAKKIGLIRAGIGKVKVEKLERSD